MSTAFCADPASPRPDPDPATGSSNGCLAAYLARSRRFGSATVEARVEQGHEMGRQSLVRFEAEDEGDAVAVRVGGRVVPIGQGRLVRGGAAG